MKLGIPQILVIIIYFMQLGVSLANNGKVKEMKISFGVSTISKLVIFGLLYWGGFFS
ncbi:hypothetical protein J4G23_00615 [Clostridioides difficile]|uniref:hypothetical protein n=1 Tax=Clostridioides difficile TaxID=1496 RepID=UPI0003F849CB|nr:hypothetical protein [Clostridioides difficile]MCJ0133353.1 hypothetical protein [Clostridioides difficile]MCJ0174379.1 hypothetical protein [Clostridioides difficile]MCU5788925.1 hypothetical protein [Clostridioides difficile]MDY6566093.1 hypothetical protein [Clostridioides difficile]STB26673.1 Uncharacterised protein [Clostridioides difficile]